MPRQSRAKLRKMRAEGSKSERGTRGKNAGGENTTACEPGGNVTICLHPANRCKSEMRNRGAVTRLQAFHFETKSFLALSTHRDSIPSEGGSRAARKGAVWFQSGSPRITINKSFGSLKAARPENVVSDYHEYGIRDSEVTWAHKGLAGGCPGLTFCN